MYLVVVERTKIR